MSFIYIAFHKNPYCSGACKPAALHFSIDSLEPFRLLEREQVQRGSHPTEVSPIKIFPPPAVQCMHHSIYQWDHPPEKLMDLMRGLSYDSSLLCWLREWSLAKAEKYEAGNTVYSDWIHAILLVICMVAYSRGLSRGKFHSNMLHLMNAQTNDHIRQKRSHFVQLCEPYISHWRRRERKSETIRKSRLARKNNKWVIWRYLWARENQLSAGLYLSIHATI